MESHHRGLHASRSQFPRLQLQQSKLRATYGRLTRLSPIPKPLPAPFGWEIQQRNARVLITDTRQHTFSLDSGCGAIWHAPGAKERDRRSGRGGHDRLELTKPFL
jgi:hypothetical protein